MLEPFVERIPIVSIVTPAFATRAPIAKRVSRRTTAVAMAAFGVLTGTPTLAIVFRPTLLRRAQKSAWSLPDLSPSVRLVTWVTPSKPCVSLVTTSNVM